MSIIRVLLLLFMINSLANGQEFDGSITKDTSLEVASYVKKSDENLYKGYFFNPYKFSGNLTQLLEYLWGIPPERIFSNKLSIIEDSIHIDMELQYELRHSNYVEDLLLKSLQRAYSFNLRDTLLSEIETVYIICVVDESRLQKNTIYEHEFLAFCTDVQVKYSFAVMHGRQLKRSLGMLRNIKTKEKISGTSLPIVSGIASEYDGLYNYAIPENAFDEAGDVLYFDSLLDINPVIFNYGLQVQKVTRPVMGKVIDFFDVPDVKLPFKFEYKY